ncbi:MAG: class I SAM-dependent methyltransferase [Gammaproteobacteria bacterium]|nr:class I SAM-dependent methyltransferase [Gammaproteobacteria bacterium]
MQLALFARHIKEGELTIVEPSGNTHRFGSGDPSVTWAIHDAAAMARILRNPALELGETYVAGAWDAVNCPLADLLTVLRNNLQIALKSTSLPALARVVTSWNGMRASLTNAAHHYDVDEAVFRAFLDADMHYSCAYFRDGDMSLEAAQHAKCAHLATKLRPLAGQRILDIGSGWGGLAAHLAMLHDVEVTGLTLSMAQHTAATARAQELGLAGRVRFLREDYRQHRGTYDRIISVGMLEHVGRRNLRTYFRTVARTLTPDGIAVVHTIASTAPPSPTNPWMRRHIFPGGYIPSLSDTAAAIERSGLVVTDVEVLRDHYAKTLAEWSRRFQARRADIAATRGEAFCRMWEFYLAASQSAFVCRELVVHQWQLAPRDVALPITRDYMYDAADHANRARCSAAAPSKASSGVTTASVAIGRT